MLLDPISVSDYILSPPLQAMIMDFNYFCFSFLQYMNTLNYLSSAAFSSIPPELVPDLQKMLSANESFRPTAMDFTGKT